MNRTPLYKKAIACAIRDIKNSIDRTSSNKIYLKWEVFHSDLEFKQAIINKQNKLK